MGLPALKECFSERSYQPEYPLQIVRYPNIEDTHQSQEFIQWQEQDAVIPELFAIKDKNVLSFIENNNYLIELLILSYFEIVNLFNSEDLQLNLNNDPDYPEDEDLVMTVVTNLSPEEAIKQLNKFNDSIWLNIRDKAEGKLSFNVDFAHF